MEEGRTEKSFARAYAGLKSGLRDGVWPGGDRLNITEFATTLNLSATPIREAMSRLAGERLLEDRAGQGYFVPRLGPVELSELYTLCLAVIAVWPGGPAAKSNLEAVQPPGPGEMVSSGAVVMAAVSRCPNALLRDLAANLDARLAPIVRAEEAVMSQGGACGLPRDLWSGDRARLVRHLHRFFAARQKAAVRIAQMQQYLETQHIRNIERI